MDKKILLAVMLLGLVTPALAGCNISFNAPANNYYTRDTTPDFNISVAMNETSMMCNVTVRTDFTIEYINNQTVEPDIDTVFTSTGLGYQNYKWMAWCESNTSNFECQTTKRTISVGTTQNSGMDSMFKIIGDFTGVIGIAVALAIIGVVILIVAQFGGSIEKFMKSFLK